MNNPIDQIQSYYESLTKTDKEIAVYIINNPRDVVTQSLETLASKTGSSKSALSRFAQKIGYTGFVEFKYEMARFLISYNGEDDKAAEQNPIHKIVATYSDYILKMGDNLDQRQLDRIAEVFLSSNKILVFGVNRSANSARQLKQRLAKIGFTSAASEEDGAVIGDYLSNAAKGDVFVIFSTTDNMKVYTPYLKKIGSVGCKVIFITANPTLPFRKQCYEYVVVPRISKDSYASFLDDQAIFFIFIEILISAIVKKKE